MNDPRIVWPANDRGGSAAGSSHWSTGAWARLGWIGAAFIVVGGVDFALVWFPLNLGNPEWEFATVTQSYNGLPILLLGVGLVLVASEEVGRRWWKVLGVAVAVLLLLWVLGGVALWAPNVGLALQSVPAELEFGVRKAVAKTLLQAIVYPVVLAYLLWRAWSAPTE